MRIDLEGRTALVTGSTAGIGRAIADGLAAAGATVIVNGRKQERAEAVAAEIGEKVGDAARIRAIGADVGSADGVAQLVEAVPELDILVNNAGIFELKPFFDIPDEEWQRIFDVNVMSGVRLARHYAGPMADRGWGRVIFISSESAVQIPAEMVHYGMTKTAQLAVSRGLAETLTGSGVTVNSVLPGPTRTEGFDEMLGGADDIEQAGRDFIAEHRPTSLLGRPSRTEEIANMVVYVASEQASSTTGAALRVDGGVTRAIP